MIKWTPSRKKWMLLFRLVGIGLFVMVLLNVDLKQTWAILKQTNLWYLIWAMLLQVLLLFIKGFRWHILKNGIVNRNVLVRDMGTFMESYAIGVFTPGRLGEMVKVGYEKSKNDKWVSAFKILAERGFDLGFFILIAGLSILYFHIIPFVMPITLLIITSGIGLIITAFMILSENKAKTMIKKWLLKFRKKEVHDYNMNLTFIQSVYIFGLSVVGNAITFISCYFLAISVSLTANFLYTSGGIAVSGLLNLLPISIMGIGIREVSFLYIFQDFQESIVLAFSFLMFFVLQIFGGLSAMVLGYHSILNNKKPK